MYKKETLVKRVRLENGELYIKLNGEMILLARCEPIIEVYEQAMSINAIGYKKPSIKRLRYSLILCGNSVYTRKVDENYLYKAKGFTLVAEKQRRDGIFERLTFDELTINDINSNMDLTLDIEPNSEALGRV